MNMTEDGWLNWYAQEATEDERYLVDRACELDEPYFNDMTFEKGSPTYSLIECQSKSVNDDHWVDDVAPLPEELLYFQLTWFHWKVLPIDQIEGSGYYDHKEQTLCVSREHLHDDRCILHELIHLHESVINELPLYFHDMVFWALYNDLKNKIPKIDEIISTHAHALNEYDIYRSGGLHDILFLLKSFDLDIKMNYPLGTVFAYGYNNDLAEYSYLHDNSAVRNNIRREDERHVIAKAERDESGNLNFTSPQNPKPGTITIPISPINENDTNK